MFVYGLEGRTGFDLLGGSTGSNLLNPLPAFIQFDDSMFWADDTGIVCSVIMLWCIAIRPQLYGAVINFLHGCIVK